MPALPLDPYTLLVVNVVNLLVLAVLLPVIMGRRLSPAARDARRSLIVQAVAWTAIILAKQHVPPWAGLLLYFFIGRAYLPRRRCALQKQIFDLVRKLAPPSPAVAEGIARAVRLHAGHAIRIGAQQYLERFYQSFGFVTVSAPYDEDGIQHIDMLRAAQTV